MVTFGGTPTDGKPENASTVQRRAREKHLSSGLCRLNELIGAYARRIRRVLTVLGTVVA
jgi:hypothetical protein